MTIFTGQTPAATYGNIITIGGSQNSGLTNVLTPLQDAYGHNTILRVSTIAFNIDRSSGDFQLDGVDVTSQAVDINSMSAPNPVALGVASLTLPVGGTAERPGVPVNGMLRYNTDFGYIESYESGTWTTAGGTITVTGTANQINATAGPNVILTISDDPIIPGTGGLQVPAGTTAQRAGAAGSIRFNTTSNLTEITNDGATWFAVSTTAGVVNSVSGTLNQITVVGAADPVVSLSSTLLFPGTVAIDNGNDLAFFDSTGVGFASFAPPVGDFVGNATYSLPDNVPAVSGYVLSSTTAGVMSWVANSAGSVISVSGTADRITIGGTAQDPIIDIASTYVGQTSITTLGTVATGTWNASVVAGQYGGTGVANTGKTITLGGNLTTSGAFNSTFTMTAATSVTFPTTGTLATTSNVVPYDIAFSAGYTSAGVAADAAVQSYGFLVMGRAGTFTGEVGYADTAPTDAALIIDVFKNGVTIYSTKPQFAATSQTLTAGTLSVTTFAAGDRVTFKITQIGSTLAGQGIRFSVKATTGII